MKRIILTSTVVCSLFLTTRPASALGPQYVGHDLYALSLPIGAFTIGVGNGYEGNPIALGQVAGSTDAGVHAVLWSEPVGAATDLHPTSLLDLSYSGASGTDGLHQVGYAYAPSQHAILWGGTAASAIDLHPTQLNYLSGSYASGVYGNQQVGAGVELDGSAVRALLWNGTAQSAIDLRPTNLSGVENSAAAATDGVQQVGFMNRQIDANTLQGHAALWSGTADSAVDLHPTQFGTFYGSQANGVGGGQQVGFGIGNSGFHALLWSGSAASAVDLQPSTLLGITQSGANGTDGVRQVGYGSGPSIAGNAILWTGSANSAVNLHALLPAGFASSYAYSLDTNGDIYGIAYDPMNNPHAVKWTQVVPEPATLLLATCGALGVCFKRHRTAALVSTH